jgi:hypothetical protein
MLLAASSFTSSLEANPSEKGMTAADGSQQKSERGFPEKREASFAFHAKTGGQPASLYEPRDRFFKILDALQFVAVNRVDYAVFHVVLEDYLADAGYGGTHGGKLRQHIAAIAVVFDHSSDGLEMAYGARQAVDDRLLLIFGMYVSVFGVAHRNSSSSGERAFQLAPVIDVPGFRQDIAGVDVNFQLVQPCREYHA